MEHSCTSEQHYARSFGAQRQGIRTRAERVVYIGACRVLDGSTDFRMALANIRDIFDKVCNDAEQGTDCCPSPIAGLEGQPYDHLLRAPKKEKKKKEKVQTASSVLVLIGE